MSRSAAVIRTLYAISAGLLTLLIVLVNVRLHIPAAGAYTYSEVGPDVVPQLRYLGRALRGGSGARMQALFPEGFFFSHVLYGLTWVEVGVRQPVGHPLREEALAEARWALEQLESDAGRAPFDPDLTPAYGVFYAGWTTWLRGGVARLNRADAAATARFVAGCEALAAAFAESETPFLPAYPGQAWPVDSVVAVAALRLHDAMLPPRYTDVVGDWLAAARARLDTETGLLPHRVDPETGALLEGARGSSQSLIQRFLVDIDPTWARGQYLLFRRQFVVSPLVVVGVREYPPGVTGLGDVDSGPLVGGVSGSATVVALGAAQVHGDRALAAPLLHLSEALGFPLEVGDTKRYALGALPVGDAFLVWSKSARPWVAGPMQLTLPEPVPRWWRLPWHALSLALVAFLWSPIWWPVAQIALRWGARLEI